MMWLFGFIATLLVVVALLFTVLPLLRSSPDKAGLERRALNISVYKDQMTELETDLEQGILTESEKQTARNELESRLLDDVEQSDDVTIVENSQPSKKTAIILAVAVPILAIYLYQFIGNPDGMEPQSQKVAGESAEGDHSVTADQIEVMVTGLAEKLKANPNDLDGWVMLARSYSALQRYDRASFAFAEATKLSPTDPNLLVDYADALAMANNESLEGSPMSLVQRALEINPNHQKGLWLMGTGAFDQGDFQGAVQYWRKLEALMAPGSQGANSIAGSIAQAEQYIVKNGGQVQSSETQAQAAPVAGSAFIEGSVTISSELEKLMGENSVLFVFAKPVDGSRLPVAVFRKPVTDLPINFRLDDTMSLMPAARLSNHQKVEVIARISKSGDAVPASGDLEGSSDVVTVGVDGINIVINKVIP